MGVVPDSRGGGGDVHHVGGEGPFTKCLYDIPHPPPWFKVFLYGVTATRRGGWKRAG